MEKNNKQDKESDDKKILTKIGNKFLNQKNKIKDKVINLYCLFVIWNRLARCLIKREMLRD